LEHPELSDANQIAEVIESPDFIAQDAVDSQRLIYYRTYQPQPQRWIKIVVEQCEVATAYKATEERKKYLMAAISIPDSVKVHFPRKIEPTQLWVNYNPNSDSLTVYFTDDKPVPSVWEDIDDYIYIGFASDDETMVTGVMIEHFSKWLLVPEYRNG
jgi:hypothetical protein